jgi:hypothetical protein
MRYNFKQTGNSLVFGLSLTAGIGLVLMMGALMVGAVAAEQAGSEVWFAFVIGLTLLLVGLIGWLVVVQPFAHFDDIDQPMEGEHSHGHDSETAIVPHEESEHAVELAQH